ncbi:MAG TPA: glycoside hydrolase family 30 beta sandwich domain-containing protein [Polyangiaceae bacterium]|nr:glycoside hydrolase family 30 beta sandwich domain-containing protein [Polyangiaceae bacterium]
MSRTNAISVACVLAYSSVACSSATGANPASGGASSSLGGASTNRPDGAGTNGSSGSTPGGSNGSDAGSSSSASGGASANDSGGTNSNGSGGASNSSPGGANANGSGGSTPSGVTVKLNATHQTIQGFGIGSAWMPSGKTLPADKVFGTDGRDAIGLSILRVGMTPNGVLTGQYVSEAKAKGAKIIGSTFSPPANCKSNAETQRGGFLLDSCFDSWSTAIAKFAQTQGLYAMSIGDEPDFASCHAKGPPCTDDFDSTTFTARQLAKWVKVAGPKLKAQGIKVIAPEVDEWNHAWSNVSATGSTVADHPHSSDPLNCGCFSNTLADTGCAQTCLDGNGYDYGHWLWKDQDAWSAFDIFGVHEHDSQTAYAWPADVNGGKRDKEVWQTEMSGYKYWPEEGPSIDIENGVAVAGWIHSALTVGEASAWIWGFYESFFQNDNQGLALIQKSATIAKRYFTLGNYSRFVRPDFIAVEVVGNSNQDVLLSAYRGPDGAVVVVAVNKGAASVTMPIAITGGSAPSMLTPTLTSATENLADKPPVMMTGGSFLATLPSMSVTTFWGK